MILLGRCKVPSGNFNNFGRRNYFFNVFKIHGAKVYSQSLSKAGMSVKPHYIKDMHAAKGALGPNSNSSNVSFWNGKFA